MQPTLNEVMSLWCLRSKIGGKIPSLPKDQPKHVDTCQRIAQQQIFGMSMVAMKLTSLQQQLALC